MPKFSEHAFRPVHLSSSVRTITPESFWSYISKMPLRRIPWVLPAPASISCPAPFDPSSMVWLLRFPAQQVVLSTRWTLHPGSRLHFSHWVVKFDDVLIADATGHVLFQKSSSVPSIADLK